jgi:hypothetical protein
MFLEGLCLERMKRLEKLTVLRLNDRQSGRRCVPKRYFLQCVDVLKRLGYGVDGCDDPAAALSTTPPSGRGLELSLDYDFFYPSDREVSVHVRADVPEESRTRDALDVKLVSRDGAVTRSIRVEPPVSLDSVVPFPLAGLEPGRWDTRGYRVEAVLGEARASRDFGLLPTPRPPQAAPAPRIEQGCLATESPQILIGTDDWRAAARIGCNASLAMPTGSALDQIRDAGLWAIATAPPFNPDDWSMFTEPAAARSGVSPRLDAYRAAAADCSDHPALLGWLVIDEPEGRYSFSAFETVEDGARFFADADDVLSKARPPRPAGVALSGNWLDRFDLFGPLSGFVFVPRDQLPRRKGPFQGLVCAGIRRQPPIPFLEAFGRTSGARHERWAAWWSLLHGARGVWFEAADPSLRQLTAELRFFAPALPAIEPVEIKPPNACLAARLSRSGVQYVVVCRRDELPAHLTVELVLPGNRTAAKVLGTEREILIDSGSLKLELAPFSVMILEVGTRP